MKESPLLWAWMVGVSIREKEGNGLPLAILFSLSWFFLFESRFDAFFSEEPSCNEEVEPPSLVWLHGSVPVSKNCKRLESSQTDGDFWYSTNDIVANKTVAAISIV